MWFAKWFGGRKEVPDDDEPARFAAPVPPETPPAASPRTVSKPAERPKAGAKTGFDPYNSGSFERRNAWERVNRR